MGDEMPAAVLRKYAALPGYLQWPVPQRQSGQALVRVLAAPISPLDLLCASGTSYFGAPKLPYIPGTQGVGIVMEADALAPGQRVWFSCDAGMKPGDGSMAQYCLIEEASAPPRSRAASPRHSDSPPLPPGWRSLGAVASSQVSRCWCWVPVVRWDRWPGCLELAV